ncbi:hypothetical protein ACHQM5_006938 [Ranunculus cassubicifolius]
MAFSKSAVIFTVCFIAMALSVVAEDMPGMPGMPMAPAPAPNKSSLTSFPSMFFGVFGFVVSMLVLKDRA